MGSERRRRWWSPVHDRLNTRDWRVPAFVVPVLEATMNLSGESPYYGARNYRHEEVGGHLEPHGSVGHFLRRLPRGLGRPSRSLVVLLIHLPEPNPIQRSLRLALNWSSRFSSPRPRRDLSPEPGRQFSRQLSLAPLGLIRRHLMPIIPPL